jgi:hypothetical protein
MAFRGPVLVVSFVLAAMFLVMSVPRLASFFGERSDIWWTPLPMALTPTEANDRVQIFVRGEPLERALESGSLLVKSGAEVVPVTAADVRLRLNNWDRRRAGRIPLLVLNGATAGAGIIFLVFGLAALFDRRRVPA